MRYIPIFFLIVLNCFIFSNNELFSQTSFKGMELYSWKPVTGIWNFSLLMGTNRNKSINEITDPKVRIVGVDNLMTKLSELQENENVFWVNYAKEPVPRKLIDELSLYSKKIGIILHIP